MTTLFPPLISLIGSSSQPPEDVRFEGVGLTLGDQQILRGISLAIRRRETVAIVGESGCGKTTLLKLLIGLLTPTQGRVVFRGKSIATMDAREQSFLRRHFGFLFQAAALFDSMSVADNIAFGLRAQGILPEKDIRPIILKMLTDVGLAPGVADKFPAELSGGMRKRVGLARALALNPEFMLFDEPTTGLDPIMTDMINDLILKVRSDLGITAILVTHEMRTVRKVADRVIMLGSLAHLDPDEPQLLFDGPVDEFMAHPDPRVQRFIQGNAQGRGENGFTSDPDSTLRWIDPQSLAPLVDNANSQNGPLAEFLPPAEIDVEAATIEVAPEAIRPIPGRMSVTLASRARRLPWELGEEFLKPEPPPPPEPRILSDSEIQATCVDVAPLAMRQIPGRTLVTLAAKPRRLPWELGEEFLKKEPEPVPAPVKLATLPEIDVEAKTLDVAPEGMDQAPGQVSLLLASQPHSFGWELGEEFLKAEPEPQPVLAPVEPVPLPEIDVEAKTLDVAPEGVAQAPGRMSLVVVPPPLDPSWEVGEEFLKAAPEPSPEPVPEPEEDSESPFAYLRSAFEDNIFRQEEPLDPEGDLDADSVEPEEEPQEELEEESDEDQEEDEVEEETGEEFEDEDEEFEEDGELDLNDEAEEEGEDFGDLPSAFREPLTDSMVLEEPLPASEPIDPFEPYTETDSPFAGEPSQEDANSESESPDTDIPPPAKPGEP